jgi:hypothetical protein
VNRSFVLVFAIATFVVAAAAPASAEEPPVPAPDPAIGRPVCPPDRLACARIDVGGWVEASLTTTPGTDAENRTARVFDVDAEGFQLQQAYLAVQRTLHDGCCFDVGAKVAVLWGTDARFLHARGLLDDQTGDEQFDLLEAHLLVRVPVARGLTFKLGKFTTPMGFEVIEAPNNLLPSRSYLFGFAIPFTHTGMIATLKVNDCLSLAYGLVLGWDVWDDPNDALTHVATVAWTSPSEKDAITVNGIVGAERPGNDDDLRVVLDGTWTHTWSDCWKTALNADVGHEEGAAPGGGDATWWGVAGYVTRTWNDRLAATGRAEVFRDADGTRLGTPASLSEVTLGLDWQPFCRVPGFHVRPEARWDHSFDGPFFDGGTDEDQFSLTLDLLFRF